MTVRRRSRLLSVVPMACVGVALAASPVAMSASPVAMSAPTSTDSGTGNDDSGTPLACVPYNPAFQLSKSNCVRSDAVPDQPDSAVRRSPLAALDSGRPVRGQGTGRPGPDDPTREYVLPAEIPGEPVLPAKIAFDDQHDRYFVSSLFDGSIYRGRLGADRAELFLPGVLPADLNGSFGAVVSSTGDDTLAGPTGIASTGDRLLVSNSQLYTVPMRAPYTVSSIEIPESGH